MFRLLLPTIIREPQGSTEVTYVFYIYCENGMVTACRFMYPMFLDMLYPVLPLSIRICKCTAWPCSTLADPGCGAHQTFCLFNT